MVTPLTNIPKKHLSFNLPLQKRNLISIPKELRMLLNISEGDILNLRLEGNKVILEPCRLVPASQAFFWSAQTQEDLKEARQNVDEGKVREFKDIEGFIGGLTDD